MLARAQVSSIDRDSSLGTSDRPSCMRRKPDRHASPAPRTGRPRPRAGPIRLRHRVRLGGDVRAGPLPDPGRDPERLAVVDPLAVGDLSPFWELVHDPARRGRDARGGRGPADLPAPHRHGPRRVFDVQIAAGLVGFSYPLSLVNLVAQVLKVALAGSETRTDWRRRPLTPAQLRYALDDVRLPPRPLPITWVPSWSGWAGPPGPRPSSPTSSTRSRTGPTRIAGGGCRACTSSAAAAWRWPGGSPSGVRTRRAARTGRSARCSATTCWWRSPSGSRPSRRDLEALRDFNRPNLHEPESRRSWP